VSILIEKEMDMTTQNACCSSCAASVRTHETDLAFACTLNSGDFEDRHAGIRNLSYRHLLSSRREPRALRLTYTAAARAEVEDVVAKETECCPFLDFELEVGEIVQLTITAKENAASAADELFAHFAPELARTMA